VYSEAEFVEKLVLSGAGVNVTDSGGWSPLMTASWYCRRQIVPFLLEHGAEVNAVDAEGYSALMHSVQNCPDGTTAALLLRWGAKINAQATKYQDTALTVAAFYGNEHAVHVLVAAGADLNAKTYRRETALTIARDRDVGRKESHDRIYHFLVEASAADKARSSRHN